MGAYDDERTILTDVGLVQDSEVCFLPEPTKKSISILFAVRDDSSWTQSERPDLYSDKHQFAIEVMRVDDHPKVGKVTNPTLARESVVEREIRATLPMVNPDTTVFVIADTGLPGGEDHNFNAYREAFARIVRNHAAKVTAYRESHPGYALALLVHDESSAYAETEAPIGLASSDGPRFTGRAHAWFLDGDFTQIIANSGADFFFWHTPFKHIWQNDALDQLAKVDLPTLAVYEIAEMASWNDQQVMTPVDKSASKNEPDKGEVSGHELSGYQSVVALACLGGSRATTCRPNGVNTPIR